MAVDINKLTLGEIDHFENLTGTSFRRLADENAFLGKPLAVLVYLFKKRENPDYTLLNAMDLSTDEANKYLGFTEDAEDETTEAGKDEGSLKKPRASKRAS